MEYDAWRESFWSKVRFVIEHGFAAVEAEIDSTYELIKSDVYLDGAKFGTNAEFDDEIPRLKGFLAARRSFLTDFPSVEKKKNLLSDLYCSDPFPSPDADDRGVVVSSHFAAAPRPSWSNISRICRPTRPGEKRSRSSNSRCSTMAATMIYRRGISSMAIVSCCPKTTRALVPYSFRAGGYSYPSNGLYYINYMATKTFALNVNHADIEGYRHLRIGDVHRIRDEYFIEIINAGELNLNLSYCSFEAGEYFNRFMFPPGTNIEGGHQPDPFLEQRCRRGPVSGLARLRQPFFCCLTGRHDEAADAHTDGDDGSRQRDLQRCRSFDTIHCDQRNQLSFSG